MNLTTVGKYAIIERGGSQIVADLTFHFDCSYFKRAITIKSIVIALFNVANHVANKLSKYKDIKVYRTDDTTEAFVGCIKSVLLQIISKLSWKMKVILESGFKSM